VTLAHHGRDVNPGELAEDLRVGAGRFNHDNFSGHTGFIHREMLGPHADGYLAPFWNLRAQRQRKMYAAADRHSEVSAISRKVLSWKMT